MMADLDRNDSEARDYFAEIAALAKRRAVAAVDEIHASTRLLSDLGLDGNDADPFIEEFAKTYDVDMTSFQWLRYFGDEGFDLLSPALVMTARFFSPAFARKWDAAREAEREITIAHLVHVAETRAWSHPGAEDRVQSDYTIMNIISVLMALALVLLVATGALACYGYLTGEIGSVNILTLAGLLGMALFPVMLAISSWRNIQRKLATA
jgi:hypothetical protein